LDSEAKAEKELGLASTALARKLGDAADGDATAQSSVKIIIQGADAGECWQVELCLIACRCRRRHGDLSGCEVVKERCLHGSDEALEI
jgi:hypothetical protein